MMSASLLDIMLMILVCFLIAYLLYSANIRCQTKMENYSPTPRQKLQTAIQNHCHHTPANNCNIYRNKKSAVLFKTHTWNAEIEAFAIKLKCDTEATCGVDFYILMHTENNKLPESVTNSSLKPHIKTYTESTIRALYSKGFYNMWLSNHWIVMWFYQNFGDDYDYIWSIEYDVRISGDSRRLWSYPGDEDFLYPVKPFQDKDWYWREHYVGDRLRESEKYYGYLQLCRYSRDFLAYLDDAFADGENGQDELIIYSLFVRAKPKYIGSHHLLGPLINDSWSVVPEDSDYHKQLFQTSERTPYYNRSLTIYHPVK